MRLFACSLLCDDRQAAYARLAASLISSSGGTLRAIPPNTAHITYGFVSHAPDERVPDLVRAIDAVARRHAPFVVRLAVPSLLYARAEARLVHVRVTDGVAAFSQLATDIVSALRGLLGAEVVSASREHHVTLARFRKNRRRAQARSVEEALERAAITDMEERIAHVQLMSSTLTSAAPVYAPLMNVELSNRS